MDTHERLAAECGPLNLVDYNGLGFNPLQVETQSPLAHIDVASELRDIFAAIFPDLGDIQTEEIRQTIKQSYVDLGWDSADCSNTHLSIPPFQAFFEILRAKPKPNPGLMARLTELADYGFFSSAGETRVFLISIAQAFYVFTKRQMNFYNKRLPLLCSTAFIRICLNAVCKKLSHMPLFLMKRTGQAD